jgi:hypothetical protein
MAEQVQSAASSNGAQSTDDFRDALARAFEATIQDQEHGPEAAQWPVEPGKPLHPAVLAAIDDAVARMLPSVVEQQLDRLLDGERPLRAAAGGWRRSRSAAS